MLVAVLNLKLSVIFKSCLLFVMVQQTVSCKDKVILFQTPSSNVVLCFILTGSRHFTNW